VTAEDGFQNEYTKEHHKHASKAIIGIKFSFSTGRFWVCLESCIALPSFIDLKHLQMHSARTMWGAVLYRLQFYHAF